MSAVHAALILGVVIMLAAPWQIIGERKRQEAQQLALRRRLQAFQHTELVRQSARAKQASYELNAFTREASRAMLFAALTAQLKKQVEASKGRAGG